MFLKATRDFTYSTRRLKAGDVFEVRKPFDAKILVAIKKAKPHREPGKVDAPPANLATKLAPAADEPVDEMTALRAEYFEKLGKRPFNGWDADTLHAKMTEG